MIRRAPAAILEEYEQARGDPYIIHYAGGRKPWQDPGEDYGTEFWEAARNTPYYEKLLAGMTGHREGRTFAEKAVDLARRAAKAVLPKGSRIRRAVGGWYRQKQESGCTWQAGGWKQICGRPANRNG